MYEFIGVEWTSSVFACKTDLFIFRVQFDYLLQNLWLHPLQVRRYIDSTAQDSTCDTRSWKDQPLINACAALKWHQHSWVAILKFENSSLDNGHSARTHMCFLQRRRQSPCLIVFLRKFLICGRTFHGINCFEDPVTLECFHHLCVNAGLFGWKICQNCVASFLETIWKLRWLHRRNPVSRSSRIKNPFSPVRCAMPSPWGWPEVQTFCWTLVGRGRMLYSGGWLKSGRIPSCQIPVEMMNHIKLITM